MYFTTFVYLLTAVLNFHFISAKNDLPEHEIWLVNASSSLRVDGKTNINSFSCLVSSYGRTDTLVGEINKANQALFRIHSILDIPIANFDCKHKIMTKDLQKTLKMSQYPTMIIDIKSLTKLPREALGGTSSGEVHISLAGTKVNYNIQFTGKSYVNQIEFVGNKTIYFSEFGLKPPSKLGGTIKVKDQLEVEVRLLLKKAG
jgi:hypothetical protein